MINNLGFSLSGIDHLRRQGLDTRIIANNSFERAYHRGRIATILAKILGKHNQLNALSSQPVSSPRPTSRIVPVPIQQIKGSLNRSTDFDVNFNPLQEHFRARWISVFTASHQGISLPAVELVQVGNTYYVRDGHHRISVAKSFGQKAIDAVIVNG
jgi:hypothetical protein